MRVVRNAAIFLVVVVAASLALVFGIPADFLASTIAKRVTAETGYRMSIGGNTRIELWPSPNLQIDKIALMDESGRAQQRRLTAESVRMRVKASSLWSGRPRLTEIAVVRPTFYVPLIRERIAPISAPPARDGGGPSAAPAGVTFDRFVVADGAIVFSDEKNAVENRLDHVELTATLTGPDDTLEIKATALAGEQILGLSVKGKVPGQRFERQTIPIEFTIEAPGLLQDLVPGAAEIKTKGSLFSISSLAGAIGRNKFNGWASVDFASKPLVKMDIDFQRLDIAVARPTASAASAAESPGNLDRPWSDQEFGLVGLNFFDAEVQFSSAELNYDRFHFAPIAVAAILTSGVMSAAVTRTGGYGGQIQGTLGVDVAGAQPRHSLRVDLTDVRALPLLTDVADFPYLDARMLARIDARGRGKTQRAIMSSLYGAVEVQFQDGQIRDVNIAKTIRTLTAGIVKGWDEKKAEKTDLSQLSAFFHIEGGRATTDNLRLVGPLVRVTGAGTADIGAKTLQFKLDPKLVTSLEGQGGSTANAVGFGVPVIVQGSWSAPRIYPEVAGILDNPDAAYDKLRELGSGLFGGSGQSNAPGGTMIQGIESLLGPKDSKPPASAPNPPPSASPSQPQAQARPQLPAPEPAPQSQASPRPLSPETETKIRDFLRDLIGR